MTDARIELGQWPLPAGVNHAVTNDGLPDWDF
jgi:hypothetical protein